MSKSHNAEVRYGKQGARTVVELIVPQGTHFKDIVKAQEIISRELLPKIGPVGCAPCISGTEFTVREELENVLPVDLATGKIRVGP